VEAFKQSLVFTVFMMLMLFGITLAVTPVADIANNLADTIGQYTGYAIITFVIGYAAFSMEGM
jgi:hypothetical protein